MRSAFKTLLGFLITLNLTACGDKPYTLNYLLSHPLVLKKEISRCHDLPAQITFEQKQECDLVNQAANQFMQMMDAEQMDAPNFGEKIIHAQMDLALAQDAVKKAKVEVNSAPASMRQAAEEKLQRAEQICEEKKQTVDQMLAVVSLGAPE